jgi:hypothetical protein
MKVPACRRCLLAVAAPLALSFVPQTPAAAFDDGDFCVAAKQLAVAADGDIGVWVDRKTRSAGMVVSCDSKTIVFRRFTYTPTAAMDGAWKEARAAEWNSRHCSSRLWTQAVRNEWKIVLSVTAFDGGNVSLNATCKK